MNSFVGRTSESIKNDDGSKRHVHEYEFSAKRINKLEKASLNAEREDPTIRFILQF